MDADRRSGQDRRQPRLHEDPALTAAFDRVLVSISDQVDGAMESTGWTQERTADAADIHRHTLQDILQIRTDPQLSTLQRLAHAFGMDLQIAFVHRGRVDQKGQDPHGDGGS